jgi:hypothetical protein
MAVPLYDPKAMIAPAGTASIERSDFIELVGIHQDKGKNVDPEERGNEMAEGRSNVQVRSISTMTRTMSY